MGQIEKNLIRDQIEDNEKGFFNVVFIHHLFSFDSLNGL